jgi:hypothetical protein
MENTMSEELELAIEEEIEDYLLDVDEAMDFDENKVF